MRKIWGCFLLGVMWLLLLAQTAAPVYAQDASLQEDIQRMEQEMTDTLREINENNVSISNLYQEISDVKKRQEETKHFIAEQKELVDARTKELEEQLLTMQLHNFTQSAILNLIRAESFSDFINRLVTISILFESGVDHIKVANESLDTLSALERELRSQEEDLVLKMGQLEAVVSQLNTSAASLKRTIDENKAAFEELQRSAAENVQLAELVTQAEQVVSSIPESDQNLIVSSDTAVTIHESIESKLKQIASSVSSSSSALQGETISTVASTSVKEGTTSSTKQEEQPASTAAGDTQLQKLYSLSEFIFRGVINWNGFKFTYYSQSVLPGTGLNIPGRHVNADGYVSDGDGYIVLAGSAPIGTVYDTPFGYKGKIYDRGTSGNHLDVYVR